MDGWMDGATGESISAHSSSIGIVEPLDQLDCRALSTSTRTHESRCLTWLNVKS